MIHEPAASHLENRKVLATQQIFKYKSDLVISFKIILLSSKFNPIFLLGYKILLHLASWQSGVTRPNQLEM